MLEKALLCGTCLKSFSRQRSLTDHVRKVHRAVKVHCCHHCGFNTKHKYALARHIERRHISRQIDSSSKGGDSEFYCDTCSKSFACQRYLTDHVRRIHSVGEVHYCHYCGFSSKVKSTLARHITRRHIPRLEDGPSRGDDTKPAVSCPLCTFSCVDREKMIQHYNETHDIKMDILHFHFEDSGQFFKWKEEMEAIEVSHFIKSGGLRKHTNDVTQYYRCSRDGVFQMKGTGKRQLKMKGSIKMGGVCPASIKAVTDKATGVVKVTFTRTHVGHQKELGRLSLTKAERAKIATKIALGITKDSILDEIRGSAENTSLKRLHLATRKDIWNIQHCFGLKKERSKGASDCTNVETMDKESEELVHCSDDQFTTVEDDVMEEPSFNETVPSNDLEDKKLKIRMKFEELLGYVQCDEHVDILWKALFPVKSAMDACAHKNRCVPMKSSCSE